jgi:hypothetical protein
MPLAAVICNKCIIIVLLKFFSPFLTYRQIWRCVICMVCVSQYLTNAQTEHRHHRPWCGGDAYGITWGAIGPHAMVWAAFAGRHDQRKTWCEWWNRGEKQGVNSIVAYGTFSTWPSEKATNVSGLALYSYHVTFVTLTDIDRGASS